MRKFNLSLDDFCPHPHAGLDFGAIRWCDKLIKDFPKLKITLFVPIRYKRLGEKEPIILDLVERPNPRYLEWIEKVRKLVHSGNYRVGAHGVNHMRKGGKYPASNNDEFQHTDRNTAIGKIEAINHLFKQIGISHNNIFRPPGWRISEAAMRALIDYGFKIAGSKEYYNKYKNKIPNLDKHWVSYNWDLTGPCMEQEDIVAYGHTSDWTNNYMNEERYKLIKSVLDKEQFDFRFIEEMR